MTRKEKIFSMALAIAPVFAKEGIDLQQSLLRNGHANCTIGDKPIPEAYAENLKYWATIFVDELNEE